MSIGNVVKELWEEDALSNDAFIRLFSALSEQEKKDFMPCSKAPYPEKCNSTECGHCGCGLNNPTL